MFLIRKPYRTLIALTVALAGVCVAAAMWSNYDGAKQDSTTDAAYPSATTDALTAANGVREPAGPVSTDRSGVLRPSDTFGNTPQPVLEPAVPISELDPADTLLDPARQKYIWDAEHVTHMMEWRFGTKFRDALVSRDRSRLETFFHESFTGRVVDPKQAKNTVKGLVTRRRILLSDGVVAEVDRAGIVDWLMGAVDAIKRIDKTSLRVLQIDRVDGQGTQWRMQLLLTARGATESGELAFMSSTHQVQCRWSDENEIDAGAIVTSWETESLTTDSCPRLLMEEVTDAVGLGQLPLIDNWKLVAGAPQKMRFQMAVEDFDRDGYLDIALADVDGRTILLRSLEGKRFVPVNRTVGIPTSSRGRFLNYSVGWIDYDNDGFPDLLMAGRLYHNLGGQRFEDVTAGSGLRFNPKLMGFSVADFDLDGRLDLYFMYSSPGARRDTSGHNGWIGDETSGESNRLWRNLGNGKFRDVTFRAGADGGLRQTLASCWLFADADPFPDLYVANDFGTNVLLRNRGDGTFEDVSQRSGTSDYATSMGVAAGDLDNDGLPEIYVANMYSKMGRRIIRQVGPDDYPSGVFQQIKGACAGNRLYRIRSGQTRYEEFAEQVDVSAVGWAYAPAMVDLDNDGLLDLYATTGFMSFERQKPDG